MDANKTDAHSNASEKAGKALDFQTVIAVTVHDMKNSLGMLLNSLEELRVELPAEISTSTKFNTLQYEAERVHNDLIQLLGIYRADRDSLSARVEEHYVPDFLEEQRARYESLLLGHQIACEIRCDTELGFFDQDLVSGVITNAVNNAIRYTTDKLLLTATKTDGYLVFGVSDNGSGFSEGMLAEAKPPEASGISFESGSTSLGLYFSRMVAALHTNQGKAGLIKLSNSGGLGGGTFELWLP